MLRTLRNSLRFYSIQLIAYELMVVAANLVAWVVAYPFRKTWSIFDMAAVWLWVYHWNKPVWSWGFVGYVFAVVGISMILEAIANRLWDGD